MAPLSSFVPAIRFGGEARVSGTVGIRAGCVVIIDEVGRVFVPIWRPWVRLERDRHGWFVRDGRSGVVLRPGDRTVGAGGYLIEPDGGHGNWRTRTRVNAFVTPDIPAECGPGVISFHSFERRDRSD